MLRLWSNIRFYESVSILGLDRKYAANCTGSKLSQCSAIIFLMRMSHRIRQYQLKKILYEIFAVDVGNYSNK